MGVCVFLCVCVFLGVWVATVPAVAEPTTVTVLEVFVVGRNMREVSNETKNKMWFSSKTVCLAPKPEFPVDASSRTPPRRDRDDSSQEVNNNYIRDSATVFQTAMRLVVGWPRNCPEVDKNDDAWITATDRYFQ